MLPVGWARGLAEAGVLRGEVLPISGSGGRGRLGLAEAGVL